MKPSSFARILCGLALFLAMSVNAELAPNQGRPTRTFAALLKGNVPGRTKIVGESISDHEWFWSKRHHRVAGLSSAAL